MQRKIEKKLLVFEIIACEWVALNCVYEEENTCQRHSLCSETDLSCYVSLKETFRDSIALPLINKYGKGAVPQIQTELRPVCHGPFGSLI